MEGEGRAYFCQSIVLIQPDLGSRNLLYILDSVWLMGCGGEWCVGLFVFSYISGRGLGNGGHVSVGRWGVRGLVADSRVNLRLLPSLEGMGRCLFIHSSGQCYVY